jgi:hypothetical protein
MRNANPKKQSDELTDAAGGIQYVEFRPEACLKVYAKSGLV